MINKWKLQRLDDLTEIELTKSLYWVDEFDWSKLAQASPRYTRAGGQALHQSEKLAGRPITLEIDKHELLDREAYETLQTWSGVAKLQMKLTHGDGRTFAVVFRNHEAPIECRPVFHEVPQEPSDKYRGKINLMTI